jgi:hypothetical protein
MIGLDRGAGDSFGKDVDTEESGADCIDNAALSLPVVAKDIILARRELKVRANEGPKPGQRQLLNDQRGSPREYR